LITLAIIDIIILLEVLLKPGSPYCRVRPLLSDYRWNLGGFGRLLSDYRWNLGGFGPCNGQKRQTLKFAHKKHNVSKILERNITSQKFQRENSSVLN
jgi:hypothetical protein